ncbi:UDP-N-acetylmuramoyl-L-alanyl-D-glutamate--2,6-diaminopimelate ligase [candidate division WOR-3 bacterium JGI_Cruoil_03_44_89]|uniref:UDP-N-acetylmuramoyl-L-alanyl-D-glutamate--2,6-diaminopimelate ligase n=1 Tax=candidate division WOR-3 bacterium JGI_Cruoil_03_44_89 TaxID=1973748 RepID=A0A235BTG3_UNCW3|nr:MAG: UDP-N-acetylmuramoyl-L-alanyl-D-glutamate--2,6-diaminopimelate ligase [candidate division WOR-3 bacterium JGI_Cruoil_03_44_89]
MLLRRLIPDNISLDSGLVNTNIKGLAYDSRDVKPGYIFFARKGERINSHRFIEDAHKRGAALFIVTEDIDIPYPKIVVSNSRKLLAVMSQRFYGEPSEKMKVIGITGTNGKSTAAILLHSIYEACGNACGLIGTIVYRISISVLPADRTTPESLDIARLMHRMTGEGVETLVMEVSSHGIAQSRIEGIDFDIAGLTCIGRDHLDFHRTLEAYVETKLSLFRTLKKSAVAVLPRGDYFNLFKSHTGARVVSYGGENGSDYRGNIISLGVNGVEMEINTPYGKEKLYSRLAGRHNISNILLAYAAAREDGLPSSCIAQGIEGVDAIPGRFERIGNVIVDFAHTPDAMTAVLESAREFTGGRIITVFGCGGDRDRGKRSMMGEVATRLSDYVFITSDNPRSEDPISIIREIEEGIRTKNYEVVPDRREAIVRAIDAANEDDIVLVLGKGHETYQIIGEEKRPFDDREVVREAVGQA